MYILAVLLALQDDDCCKEKSACCEKTVVLTLKSVEAGCCTKAVADALKKRVGETSSVPEANKAVIKKDTVRLSDVEAAIKDANDGMGKRMKLTYALDETQVSLRGSTARFEGKKADLEKAFAGQKVAEEKDGIVAISFDDKTDATLASARKAGTLKDVEIKAPLNKCCVEKAASK